MKIERILPSSIPSSVIPSVRKIEVAGISEKNADVLLSVRGLVKRYGGLVVTNHVDLDLRAGEVHALLGPNGAGKTSLLAQLTGEVEPNAGRIEFEGRDITHMAPYRRAQLGIGRSFQITSIFQELSVLENVQLAVQVHAGHSFRFWRPAAGQKSLEAPALHLLDRVGLASAAMKPASHLSHGQHRQLEIAIALAGEPRLLLLDEPMAGMGVEDTLNLTEMLLTMKGSVTMLLVEHDMDAVFKLADRITVLVYGQRIATGSPAEIRDNTEVRRAYLGEGRF
ncbi:MAG: ABC transporter ATP-binding protein [Burkholderiaceae bacterium]|nr:ABC transporter ATP-binding protein [Burkholderiaceae bacterium]